MLLSTHGPGTQEISMQSNKKLGTLYKNIEQELPGLAHKESAELNSTRKKISNNAKSVVTAAVDHRT